MSFAYCEGVDEGSHAESLRLKAQDYLSQTDVLGLFVHQEQNG